MTRREFMISMLGLAGFGGVVVENAVHAAWNNDLEKRIADIRQQNVNLQTMVAVSLLEMEDRLMARIEDATMQAPTLPE